MTTPLADGYSSVGVPSPEPMKGVPPQPEQIDEAHPSNLPDPLIPEPGFDEDGEPIAEATEEAEVTEWYAEHSGGGWYHLRGGPLDGEKVQGRDNVPDEYRVVDDTTTNED